MKNQLRLQINKPCSENYNQFTPTYKGGFCNSCTKEVIDFTAMKDDEIVNYFKTNSDKKTCGRFKSHQLKTCKDSTKTKPRFSFASRIGIACLALFAFGNINAQQKTTQKGNASVSQESGVFTVKGSVKESDEAIPGVNIVLQGTSVGTVTDYNGNFVFPKKLKKGDVLIFSYVGYKSQKVVINDQKTASNVSLKLDMELDTVYILGSVSSKKVYKSSH